MLFLVITRESEMINLNTILKLEKELKATNLNPNKTQILHKKLQLNNNIKNGKYHVTATSKRRGLVFDNFMRQVGHYFNGLTFRRCYVF
jgi:hypothetical protein